MQRALLIPYATNERNGLRVTAEELQDKLADWRDTIRLDATLDHDTVTRQVTHYLCPACGKPVYPHAPFRPTGRHFWSHRPKSAETCPLAINRPLSPEQINRLIFDGRQESQAHRNLVNLLAQLAEGDPGTIKGTVKTGTYEPPSPALRDEFPHGRFPDVSFTYGRDRVILEAQLATIALHGINGRRAYYDRHEKVLLWVTRNFDPVVQLRASVKDILADQNGLLLSVDEEALERSAAGGVFHLRAWIYEHKEGKAEWNNRVLPLADVLAIARPRHWSDGFKERFIVAYDGRNYFDDDQPHPLQFLNEAMRRLKLREYESRTTEADELLFMMRLMISLEAGRPIGSAHPKVISLANSFDIRSRHRYRALVKKAIEHWRPELLAQRSVQNALKRSSDKLKETGEKPYGRSSIVGRLRELLFPRWDLGPAVTGAIFSQRQLGSPMPETTEGI